MSGHSKWSTIKHKKAATDKKRGDIFSKLARNITIAVKQGGGGDIETNYTLRSAIEKAKNLNMPKNNIERAIKKGTGEVDGETLDTMLMEVYAPDGVALLIDIVTDNRNRTTSEIKHILSRNNAKLATEGSVQWLFERRGVLKIDASLIKDNEEFELSAIDAGADDISFEQDEVFVYTLPQDIQQTQQTLTQSGYPSEASLAWIAKESVQINEATQKTIQRIFEALNEHEDVQELYTNAE